MPILRTALLLGAAALPLAPAIAAPVAQTTRSVAVKPLAYTERTLANGLRIYAVRDTSATTVSVHMWYNVGSKDDPRDRSGFAHLFEHLMFKATRNLPSESFDRLTEDVGGFNNATTNDDYTNYFETVPANHLERILFAEADRMASLVVDPASFKSERDVVKEEFRLRILADPYGKLFGLYLPEVSYARHPYARPGIGSLANLDAATIDDVRAFHATYYRPDNAVLVVAGNFDPAQLNTWVDKYFAPIKRPDRPIPRVTVAEPPRIHAIAHTIYGENVPLPAIVASYQIPPDRAPDAAPLAVLNAILSAGDSSRLHQSLVYRDQLAADAGSFLDSKQGLGSLAVYAIVAGGKSAALAEAALKREVARMRTAPVSAAELARAKNQLLTQAIRDRETPDGKASTLAEAVVIDGDARAADRGLAQIASVTAADVLRVARRYLGDNQVSFLRYLPARPGAHGDTIGVPAGVSVAALKAPADVAIVTPASDAERAPLPAPGTAVQAAPPPITEARLANGLRVITVERHDLPLAAATLSVPGGAGTDTEDTAGLSNLTASLLTKGTATRSATAIAREIEALGGSISSSATWDGATLSIEAKSDQLAPAMTVMADVARHPAFAAAEIDRERARATDGIDVQLKNPAQLASLVAGRAVFGDAPYGNVSGGTPRSLKAITREAVVGAYRTAWRPDRATLVVTGDITPAATRALAERLFGDWRAPAGGPVETPTLLHGYPDPRVIVVDLPGAGQAGVVVARPGIARNNPAYPAMALANSVLGGGYSSRLNQEIRVKRGLSYGAGSSVDARLHPGQLSAATQTKNPSAPEVVDLILEEMRKLSAAPANAAELDARKQVLIGSFGRSVETVGGLDSLVSGYVLENVPLDELRRYVPTIAALDPVAVQGAARSFDPDRASIIVVGDAKLFVEELRKKFPRLELIAADKVDLDSAALK